LGSCLQSECCQFWYYITSACTLSVLILKFQKVWWDSDSLPELLTDIMWLIKSLYVQNKIVLQ
jgi:hypothetical protein